MPDSKQDQIPSEEESSKRFGKRMPTWITILIVVMALYHILYIARVFDRMELYIYAAQHRAISVMCILVTIFLLFPITKSGRHRNYLPRFDIILILLSIVAFGYGAVFYGHVEAEASDGLTSLTTSVICFLGILLLCEAGRRTIGLPMVVLALGVVFHSHFADLFPGILQAPRYPPQLFSFIQYVGSDGIFGVPVGVYSTIIIMFVIFAHFLRVSGAGDFFLNLAFSLVGHIRGGPAKAAAVSSGLFGMVSGSPSANVAGTGVITIPLMKRIGLTPAFAGGVEAAASTGGMFMPPVMGAVAFIMAEWLSIPYIKVCIVAAVPAVLYYVAVYVMIDGESWRLKISGLPRHELPSLKKVLRKGWYHLLPVILLVILMAVVHFRPDFAALCSVIVIVAMSMFRKETRMGPKKIAIALRDGVIGSIPAGIACALAGVILGGLTLTGVGINLSSAILTTAGGNLFIALVLAAAASIILGMGMPAVPVYIMLVILVAPAVANLGVPIIAAHLFIFYFGMLSFITPPVATAAYTASAIADSNPVQTAVCSMRIGIVAGIVPFVFVYNPGLLFMGSAGEIIKAITAATVGVVSLSMGVSGYALGKANWGQRTLLVAGGLLLFFPSWLFNLIGLAIFVLLTLPRIRRLVLAPSRKSVQQETPAI